MSRRSVMWPLAAACMALLAAMPCLAHSAGGVRSVRVPVGGQARSAMIASHIKGYETVDYLVRVKAGQHLAVRFDADSHSAYFNVLPPQADSASFTGAIDGDRYSGIMPTDGDCTVRVYLMRNAARRGEVGHFRLYINVDGAAADDNALPPTHP
ncbi:MAG: hypothetical protein QM639_13180 [Rhodocyclaceae bacterium]